MPIMGIPIDQIHTRATTSLATIPRTEPQKVKLSETQIIKERIRQIVADKAPEKNYRKFVAGIVPLMGTLDAEEREIFYSLLEQQIEDHPDYGTTHDAWTIYRSIVNEIRLLRISQYEMESFSRAKQGGFLDKPEFLARDSEIISREMSKLSAEGLVSRQARDGIGGNIRLTISAIAANINQDRLGAVQSIHVEEENTFLIGQEKQQQLLASVDTASEVSIEQLMRKINQVESEYPMPKMSAVGYENAEAQE